MKFTKKTIFILVLVIFALQKAYAFQYADAKITIRVIDENGNIIPDALVTGGFFSKDIGSGGTNFKGQSNNAGEFSVSARTHGEVSCLVRRDGYYYTSRKYREWFKGNGKVEAGKWSPWNPTIEVVLKKVEDPVPMYAKKVNVILPYTDKLCGFDLEKGDWVAPHGAGRVSDFVFSVSRTGKEWGNFEIVLTLNFKNKGDGIQKVMTAPSREGSFLRLSKNAPEDNYREVWVKKLGNNPVAGYYNLRNANEQAFIYRVRTKFDKSGKIVSARYGKIHGDFRLSGYLAPQITLSFTYYFNPDGTRNLEFDPQKNLFQNLSQQEQVREP